MTQRDPLGPIARALHALWQATATRGRPRTDVPRADPGVISYRPRYGADVTPHYGKVFHDRVARALSRQRPPGTDDVYDTVREAFDVPYYLMRYKDVAQAEDIDPVAHYIRDGVRERRDPSPFFSTRYYMKANPGVAKQRINPLYHYLRYGYAEGRSPHPFSDRDTAMRVFCKAIGEDPEVTAQSVKDAYRDRRERLETGELGAMVAKAAALEPLIAHGWSRAVEMGCPPFTTPQRLVDINAINGLHHAVEGRTARAVIAVNRSRWGSGRRMEGYIAHALAGLIGAGEVIVAFTDHVGSVRPGRFPEGCRIVNFAAHCGGIAPEERERLFVEFVRSLGADALFIVNSRLAWNALRPYGKALAKSVRIYAGLFCGEQSVHGYWHGYPYRYFYRHFDVLSGVATDSHALARELRAQFLVPQDEADKLVVFEAPVDDRIAPVPPPASTGERRPTLFWSGRFDRQKRVDVVYALAERMPDVDILMWGEPVLDKSAQALTPPANVKLLGVYSEFGELPLHQCDLWLYTSEWDGVPSILLEVAMTATPIVGSKVGGTGEILREGMSWPVAEIDDPNAYETAIRAVLADQAAAREKAMKLRETLIAERTEAAYQRAVERLLTRRSFA